VKPILRTHKGVKPIKKTGAPYGEKYKGTPAGVER